MPRTYKKNKRRGETSDDLSKLTGMRDYFLRTGVCLSGREGEMGFPQDDLMSARRLWIMHKAELMQRQDLKNPGYRPWAWWRFEQNIEPASFQYGGKLAYLREHKLLMDWELQLL